MRSTESSLPTMTGPSVLIIDDDPAVREALKKVLIEAGYAVVAAADGREGSLKLEQQTFQLLLLDLDLPKVSGWDILDLTVSRWPSLPVIILTAFSSECVPGALAGADALVEKPPDVGRLLNTIAILVSEPMETRLRRRRDEPLRVPASSGLEASYRRRVGSQFLCG